ncbi:SAM-dependent methyltransferase (plasmid) [Streptomyces sp. GDS52]|uniref:SAM-dependent methyltransferase n=1 Tax=Streptomyces sp. GDS52 TaxID=3406419 RepID=UPI003FD5F0FB
MAVLPEREPNGLRVLDVYCCQGGASMGYHLAGFDVVGVDLHPQPRYPFAFHQGDAVAYIRAHGHEFDLIVGSPPCQRYSNAQRIQGREHPDLIGPTREAMEATGRPWVIENVEDAGPEMRDPITLCGASFGLRTYRHRLFESSFPLAVPHHPRHLHPTVKMGRPLREGDWYHAVGNFSNVPYVRRDMRVGWMSRDGIRECIPPAYTEFVGRQAVDRILAPLAA